MPGSRQGWRATDDLLQHLMGKLEYAWFYRGGVASELPKQGEKAVKTSCWESTRAAMRAVRFDRMELMYDLDDIEGLIQVLRFYSETEHFTWNTICPFLSTRSRFQSPLAREIMKGMSILMRSSFFLRDSTLLSSQELFRCFLRFADEKLEPLPEGQHSLPFAARGFRLRDGRLSPVCAIYASEKGLNEFFFRYMYDCVMHVPPPRVNFEERFPDGCMTNLDILKGRKHRCGAGFKTYERISFFLAMGELQLWFYALTILSCIGKERTNLHFGDTNFRGMALDDEAGLEVCEALEEFGLPVRDLNKFFNNSGNFLELAVSVGEGRVFLPEINTWGRSYNPKWDAMLSWQGSVASELQQALCAYMPTLMIPVRREETLIKQIIDFQNLTWQKMIAALLAIVIAGGQFLATYMAAFVIEEDGGA